MKRITAVLACTSLLACSSDDEARPQLPDATTEDAAVGIDAGSDAAPSDATLVGDAADADVALTIPALGVYTIDVDGGGLSLLIDTKTRELSHVRAGPGGWLIATRYAQDPDKNGLAMENENGFPGFYTGTEIVVFHRDTPTAQTVIAGSAATGIAANPSWTSDGKALFLESRADAGAFATQLSRATFGVLPNVTSTAVVPVPAELVLPVDPHQHGPSDATGFITFTANVNLAAKWMRPVWKMSAAGTTVLGEATFVGCPICPSQGGCCGFDQLAQVIGTNDSRISNSGGDVLWMQQHPDITGTVGAVTFSPFRQAMRPLDGGAQVDLNPPGTDSLTSHAYGEWRSDDAEIVYWSIEVENAVARHFLWRMNRDGTNRRKIPLPSGLCALHPSYLTDTQIVFNAWRGAPPDGSCDPARL